MILALAADPFQLPPLGEEKPAAPTATVSAKPIVVEPPAAPANEVGAPDTLSKDQIQALLHLSPVHTHRLLRQAKLQPVRSPSGGLGRVRRYARADVERFVAGYRMSKEAARVRLHPLNITPQPQRPLAPKAQRTLDGPGLSPTPHDDALDPVALGVKIPRGVSGAAEASPEIEDRLIDSPPGEASKKRQRYGGGGFFAGGSKASYPIGRSAAQLALAREQDRARAAALAAYNPALIKRVPSDHYQAVVSENARFAAETERLNAATGKPFKSGTTIEERRERDRDEQLMIQRATWIARGVMPAPRRETADEDNESPDNGPG